MHVKELVQKVKGLAVKAGGFMRRHKRLTIAVMVAALLFGPLVTTDGELVVLNAVGLGPRCAAAQAVHQARRQAANGTGATATEGKGNNTKRRRTR